MQGEVCCAELAAVTEGAALVVHGGLFWLPHQHTKQSPHTAAGTNISRVIISVQAQQVYKQCKQMFAALPLAAVVGGAALVVHGGLFRRPFQRAAQRGAGGQAPPKKRKRYAPMRLANASLILGSLEVCTSQALCQGVTSSRPSPRDTAGALLRALRAALHTLDVCAPARHTIMLLGRPADHCHER